MVLSALQTAQPLGTEWKGPDLARPASQAPVNGGNWLWRGCTVTALLHSGQRCRTQGRTHLQCQRGKRRAAGQGRADGCRVLVEGSRATRGNPGHGTGKSLPHSPLPTSAPHVDIISSRPFWRQTLALLSQVSSRAHSLLSPRDLAPRMNNLLVFLLLLVYELLSP